MPTYIPEVPQPGRGLPGRQITPVLNPDPTQNTTQNPGRGSGGGVGGHTGIPEVPPTPGMPPGAIRPQPSPVQNQSPGMQLPSGTLTQYGIYQNPVPPAGGYPQFTSDMQNQLAEFQQSQAPKLQAISQAMQQYGGHNTDVGAIPQGGLSSIPGYSPSPTGPGIDQQQVQMNALKNILSKMKLQGV